MVLRFEVLGDAVPQGSKRIVGGRGRGTPRVIDANHERLTPWRAVVSSAAADALAACGIDEPMTGPVAVDLLFYYRRPDAHFGTGKNAGQLKVSAPAYKQTTPDLDKLARAVLDSLTDAGVWRDDSQVAVLRAAKGFSLSSHVTVKVETL